MNKSVTILPLLMLMAGCSQPADYGQSSEFSSRENEWEAAFNAKDFDAITALYADDARLMPPNGTATVGHDGIRATFGGMIDAGLSVDLTSIETKSRGDIAYVVGTYQLLAGDEVADRGKYIETWHRSNGDWHMANDIWNSDLPAAGGGDGNTHVMILHEVEDFDRWIAAWRGKNSRHDQFRANGAAHLHTFQNADNPNLTGLVISVSDLAALNAFLASEEGASAAAADGVDLDAMTVLAETE